jgi:hypothetical protein
MCQKCVFSEREITALKACAKEKMNELTPEEEEELARMCWDE